VLDLLDARPRVIFVTAYDSYAIKAFEVNVIDYLLKPFSRERFEKALLRVAGKEGDEPQDAVDNLIRSNRSLNAPIERILVRDGSRVHVIPSPMVDHIEAQDDYVSIHSGGKKYLKLERLSDMLEEVLESGEKALVFTQFKEMGYRLQLHLNDVLGFEPPFLHGGSSREQRDEMVRSFQEDEDGA